jgi:formylglycine-generating enzyme required for sulfatase activity
MHIAERKRSARAIWVPACVFIVLAALLAAGCNGNGNGTSTPANLSWTMQIVKDKTTDIEMVVIPAGSFNMGSRSGPDNEKPMRKVSIDSFCMDRTEVTRAAFERIGKEGKPPLADPSRFRTEANLPVQQIKWEVAAAFCNIRSKLEGLEPCYNDKIECDFSKNGYRLPTEAEWEYACRAGTETDYSFGDSSSDLGDHAWYNANSAKTVHPVAQKKANPWGLFDMHGNVAEWCHDVYAEGYYKVGAEINPRGPAASANDDDQYVLRGGSWKSPATACRSAYRLGENPGFSDACLAKDAIGFRCVRKAP